MINYQSENPKRNFLMIENEAIDELSSDAFYLYAILRKLASNEANTQVDLMKKTKFKEWKFKKSKAELIDKSYLDIKQLHGNYYAFYIGKEEVLKYKTSFKKCNNRRENNQLKKIYNKHI